MMWMMLGMGPPAWAAEVPEPSPPQTRVVLDYERYAAMGLAWRRQRLTKIGAGLSIAGSLAVPVGLVFAVSGGFGRSPALAVAGAALLVVGGGSAVVGTGLYVVGGFGTARAIRRAGGTTKLTGGVLSTAGLGLVLASMVVPQLNWLMLPSYGLVHVGAAIQLITNGAGLRRLGGRPEFSIRPMLGQGVTGATLSVRF